jgi:hypothetical protein
VQNAPRHRAPPRRFGFDGLGPEKGPERAVTEQEGQSPPKFFGQEIDETPPPSTDKPSKKNAGLSRPSETSHPCLDQSPQMPCAPSSHRARIPSKRIKECLKSIDWSLQNVLRVGFDACDLEWTLPITFADQPSVPLRELYQLCLGRNWHTSYIYAFPSEDLNALCFVVALVGAGVYSQILCPGSSGVKPDADFCRTVPQECGASYAPEARGRVDKIVEVVPFTLTV